MLLFLSPAFFVSPPDRHSLGGQARIGRQFCWNNLSQWGILPGLRWSACELRHSFRVQAFYKCLVVVTFGPHGVSQAAKDKQITGVLACLCRVCVLSARSQDSCKNSCWSLACPNQYLQPLEAAVLAFPGICWFAPKIAAVCHSPQGLPWGSRSGGTSLLAPGLKALKPPAPLSLGGGTGAALRERTTDTAVLRFHSFFSNKQPLLHLWLISGVLVLLFLTVLSRFVTAFLSRGALPVADFVLFLGWVAY